MRPVERIIYLTNLIRWIFNFLMEAIVFVITKKGRGLEDAFEKTHATDTTTCV